MEKVSELGDAAKRRLGSLMAQFNQHTAATAPAAVQQEAAAERRGLLDEDMDDMELAARKDL
jgi:hypothetical protein